MREMDANTNKVYRKKYFMDADKVVFSEEFEQDVVEDEATTLISAEVVQMNEHPVPITHGLDNLADSIQVEAIKKDDHIEKLKITCPCGRTTELDIQYKTAPIH